MHVLSSATQRYLGDAVAAADGRLHRVTPGAALLLQRHRLVDELARRQPESLCRWECGVWCKYFTRQETEKTHSGLQVMFHFKISSYFCLFFLITHTHFSFCHLCYKMLSNLILYNVYSSSTCNCVQFKGAYSISKSIRRFTGHHLYIFMKKIQTSQSTCRSRGPNERQGSQKQAQRPGERRSADLHSHRPAVNHQSRKTCGRFAHTFSSKTLV